MNDPKPIVCKPFVCEECQQVSSDREASRHGACFYLLPDIENIQRALLIAAAIALRHDDKPVPLVERPRPRVHLEAVQPQPAGVLRFRTRHQRRRHTTSRFRRPATICTDAAGWLASGPSSIPRPANRGGHKPIPSPLTMARSSIGAGPIKTTPAWQSILNRSKA
jgi:hypothetical protein